jgi:hypothetical protein
MAQTPEQVKAKKMASLNKKIDAKDVQIGKYEARKTAKGVIQAGYVNALATETVAKKIASLNNKNVKAIEQIAKYTLAIDRLSSARLILSQALAALLGQF